MYRVFSKHPYLPGNGGAKQEQEPSDGPRPEQPLGRGEGAEGRPEEVAQGGARAHGLCRGLCRGKQRVSQVKTLHKRRLLEMVLFCAQGVPSVWDERRRIHHRPEVGAQHRGQRTKRDQKSDQKV